MHKPDAKRQKTLEALWHHSVHKPKCGPIDLTGNVNVQTTSSSSSSSMAYGCLSSEGHTAYLYKCTHAKALKPAKQPLDVVAASDPLWRETFQVLTGGESAVADWVAAKQAEDPRMNGTSARPRTRAQSKADA
jgi:hypothetical protein